MIFGGKKCIFDRIILKQSMAIQRYIAILCVIFFSNFDEAEYFSNSQAILKLQLHFDSAIDSSMKQKYNREEFQIKTCP